MLRRRVDHSRTESYAELFQHLEPGQLLAEPPATWALDWALADPDALPPVTRPHPRGTADDHCCRAVDRGPRRARRPHGVGRRRRRAEPGHRRHPPRGPHRVGRRAPRGGRRVRRRRAGPAHRPRSGSAWAPSARARSTCSTGCTTPRSRTPRCSRSAGRCRARSIGSDFFQEVDNDALFADVAVFNRTVTSVDQLPALIEQAGQRRARRAGRGGADAARGRRRARPAQGHRAAALRRPAAAAAPVAGRRCARPPRAINAAGKVTLLVGQGARHARAEVLRARRAARRADGADPQGQGGLRGRQRLRDRPVRADRQPRHRAWPSRAATCWSCSAPTSPTRRSCPTGKTVVQLDVRGAHIGRRTPVDHALVGDARLGLAGAAAAARRRRPDRDHLDKARHVVRRRGASGSSTSTDPDYDRKPKGLLRRKVDNPDARIRPELLAAAVDRHAAADAVFTTDTGMATVWLSRFVRMTGTRRLLGSYNLGSMANAMPQALGAARARPGPPGRRVLRRRRPLDADGRPDHRGHATTSRSSWSSSTTAGSAWSSWRWSRSGCRSSAPCCTTPTSPRSPEAIGLHGIRVERPARRGRRGAGGAGARRVRCCSTCSPTPTRSPIPPKPTLEQGWGFAIAKSREFLDSHGA